MKKITVSYNILKRSTNYRNCKKFHIKLSVNKEKWSKTVSILQIQYVIVGGGRFWGCTPTYNRGRGWVLTFCIVTHFTQKHHMCMTVTSSCKSCSPLPSPSTEKLSFNFKYSSCSNLSCSSFRFRSSSSFSPRNLFNWLNYDSFHTRS